MPTKERGDLLIQVNNTIKSLEELKVDKPLYYEEHHKEHHMLLLRIKGELENAENEGNKGQMEE